MIEKVTVTAIVVVALSLGNALAADPPVANDRGPRLQFELVDGTVITGITDIKAITIQIASGNVLKVPVAELTELSVGGKGQTKPQSKIRAGETVLLGTVTVKTFRIASPYGPVTAKLDNIRRIRPGVRDVSVKGGQWSVQLRDKTKTHLRGIATGQSLRVQTRYGTMIVPPAQIWKATFAAAGKSISVQCLSSDRIAGTLGPKTTISFKTDKGRVDIPAGKIAAIMYDALLTFDLGKGVTMKLVRIPAGKFMMGSPKTENGHEGREGPQRLVTISKAFYMGIYEITQSQYQSIMDKNPSKFKGPRNPVEQVSWHDATAFCAALSKKTGRAVRLPTEAQWEYACRAGTKTRFSFGDDDKDLDAHGWYKFNSGAKTHPVGQKKPNPAGLYDMHGNVGEWCSDWYDESYATTDTRDPKGPATGKYRVLRGGSWYNYPRWCRAAKRFKYYTNSHFGFRVVVVSGLGVD